MSKTSDTNAQWLLADRALTPIISSVPLPTPDDEKPSQQKQMQLRSLTSLTTTAISAFESASRLGLGLPQRIVVETKSGGPVVLHAYLNPPSRGKHNKAAEQPADEQGIVEQARGDLRPLTATTDGASEHHHDAGESSINGAIGSEQSAGESEDDEEDSESSSQQSPLLIASVVALGLGEAKKAIGGLERTGREIQRALILERQQENTQNPVEGSSDG